MDTEATDTEATPTKATKTDSLLQVGIVLAVLIGIIGALIPAIMLFSRNRVGPGLAVLLTGITSTALAVVLIS